MTPEQEMRKAAKDLAEYASYAEIVGGISVNRRQIRECCDRVFASLRAPEPQPDPRDAALAKAREALREIHFRALPHGPHNMICNVAQRALTAIESALRGGAPEPEKREEIRT